MSNKNIKKIKPDDVSVVETKNTNNKSDNMIEITITIDNLNVRANPDKTADILGLAKPGTYKLLDVIETDCEKWGHIEYLNGWVNLAYTSYFQE